MVDAASFRKRMYDLQNEANRDPLTGLFNRRGFQNALAAIDIVDLPIAMCIFDLDDLKNVNDTYGHQKGDQALQCFSKLLCCQTRSGDVKCRYGGDEFVVVLKNIGDAETARQKAETICRLFHESGVDEQYSTACSVGIAFCDSEKELSTKLFEHADQALYRAKEKNKGGCCVWKEEEINAKRF